MQISPEKLEGLTQAHLRFQSKRGKTAAEFEVIRNLKRGMINIFAVEIIDDPEFRFCSSSAEDSEEVLNF